MNKKITDLVTATALLAQDALLLVQNSTSKKISIERLFGSGIPVSINAKSGLHFGASPEVISTGAISTEVPVTHLNLTDTILTIGPAEEGQVKFIIAIAGAGFAAINANVFGNTIAFQKVGDAAMLLYSGGQWAFVGGTAQVS